MTDQNPKSLETCKIKDASSTKKTIAFLEKIVIIKLSPLEDKRAIGQVR
jgi:hypothetical protein